LLAVHPATSDSAMPRRHRRVSCIRVRAVCHSCSWSLAAPGLAVDQASLCTAIFDDIAARNGSIGSANGKKTGSLCLRATWYEFRRRQRLWWPSLSRQWVGPASAHVCV
jgi:hypothetical protein